MPVVEYEMAVMMGAIVMGGGVVLMVWMVVVATGGVVVMVW